MAEEADKKPCTFFKKTSGARAAVRKRRHVSENSGKDDCCFEPWFCPIVDSRSDDECMFLILRP